MPNRTPATPLAVLRDPATIRLRCAAVTRAVDDGARPASRSTAARCRARPSAWPRSHASASRPAHPVPQPLAPLRGRRRDRKAELDAALAGAARPSVARAVRPGGGERAARRRRRRRSGATPNSRRRAGTALPVHAPAARRPAGDAHQAASGASARRQPRRARTGASAAGRRRRVFTRSEGLGVASFRAFMAGRFSSPPVEPLRVDAAALRHVDAAALRARVPERPVQPAGRAGRPRRAAGAAGPGAAARGRARRSRGEARGPALLFDRSREGGTHARWRHRPAGRAAAHAGADLASGSQRAGVPAGDVWPHRWAGAAVAGGGTTTAPPRGWVPFHKLSQWLSYSLLEPLQWAGVRGHRAGRADRPARIPQRRPAASTAASSCRAARAIWSAPGSRPTSSSSSGAR
jgi:hypothetical protein